MEVECGANAAVRCAGLADDLFNATTEGVVGGEAGVSRE
jgi:hypothetical protein